MEVVAPRGAEGSMPVQKKRPVPAIMMVLIERSEESRFKSAVKLLSMLIVRALPLFGASEEKSEDVTLGMFQ